MAFWLAKQPAVAPVIVHMTNTIGAEKMLVLLVESGWSCCQVVPYGGEDWIVERWFPLVRKEIKKIAADHGGTYDNVESIWIKSELHRSRLDKHALRRLGIWWVVNVVKNTQPLPKPDSKTDQDVVA